MAPLSGKKGILFDLDGTLVDTYHLLAVSHAYATKTVLGVDIPEERLMSTVGMPLETQMGDYCDNDPETVAELCRVYRVFNAKQHDALIKGFPHVADVLGHLKEAGFKLGVVTSKRADVALQSMSVFGLQHFMECLVGGHDCPTHKPAPGPVLEGCKRLELKSEDCVYVGDSPFDIHAGNAAGCETIAALWGMFEPEKLKKEGPSYEAFDMLGLERLFVG